MMDLDVADPFPSFFGGGQKFPCLLSTCASVEQKFPAHGMPIAPKFPRVISDVSRSRPNEPAAFYYKVIQFYGNTKSPSAAPTLISSGCRGSLLLDEEMVESVDFSLFWCID